MPMGLDVKGVTNESWLVGSRQKAKGNIVKWNYTKVRIYHKTPMVAQYPSRMMASLLR